MQRYIEACANHPNARRATAVLDNIIPDAALHARFVNTLARLEYVGVRKMFKSRHAARLDLDGLQHMLDETVHALRLKKAATTLAAATGTRVPTFSDDDTLAGHAGEDYMQSLDRRAEADLINLAPERRVEANYLLTTAVVEVRAQVFYPIYDRCLAAHRVGFSVAAIMKDEDRHLAEMARTLELTLADWRARMVPLLAAEESFFGDFLDHLEAAVAISRAA